MIIRTTMPPTHGTTWPYATPMYTGIKPIFSQMGAPPGAGSDRALLAEWELHRKHDHRLHELAKSAKGPARAQLDGKRRDVRSKMASVERKLHAHGWVLVAHAEPGLKSWVRKGR